MANILQQYYHGITQQLRAEVDFINTLFEHQGVKGEGNETILRDLITKFIPKRYGVGTGVVIDRYGKPSRQCDIIIYDTFLYPSLLSLTSVHLFPVDIVYATIEVKTTLTSERAKEAIDNIASTRSLDFLKLTFPFQRDSDGNYTSGFMSTSAPLGFVFAYNNDAEQAETFKKWFIPGNNAETLLYPSLIGCLDTGIIFYRPQGEDKGEALLYPRIDMQAKCNTFPLARRYEQSLDIKSAHGFEFMSITGPESGNKFTTINGIRYPLKKIDKVYRPIDQGKVLINFLLILNDFLTQKEIHPSISFWDTYLDDLSKAVVPV